MPPEPIEIREARLTDLEAIFAIYNHEVLHETSTFQTEPLNAEADRSWLERREPRYPVLVATAAAGAEPGGEVVGWGSLTRWSPRGAYARTAEVSVYVDRNRRGDGIGRSLLQALIARAPASEIAVLLARISGENPASVVLHEHLGFEPIGVQRRCGEKFGRILDVTLMDLHLDSGGAPATH